MPMDETALRTDVEAFCRLNSGHAHQDDAWIASWTAHHTTALSTLSGLRSIDVDDAEKFGKHFSVANIDADIEWLRSKPDRTDLHERILRFYRAHLPHFAGGAFCSYGEMAKWLGTSAAHARGYAASCRKLNVMFRDHGRARHYPADRVQTANFRFHADGAGAFHRRVMRSVGIDDAVNQIAWMRFDGPGAPPLLVLEPRWATAPAAATAPRAPACPVISDDDIGDDKLGDDEDDGHGGAAVDAAATATAAAAMAEAIRPGAIVLLDSRSPSELPFAAEVLGADDGFDDSSVRARVQRLATLSVVASLEQRHHHDHHHRHRQRRRLGERSRAGQDRGGRGPLSGRDGAARELRRRA